MRKRMRRTIMIIATILSLEASDLQARNTAIKDTAAKDSKIKNTPVKDLGIYGEVFPIQERSLLEVIKAKLQALSEAGKLMDHQNAIVQKTRERLARPEPVTSVRKTT